MALQPSYGPGAAGHERATVAAHVGKGRHGEMKLLISPKKNGGLGLSCPQALTPAGAGGGAGGSGCGAGPTAREKLLACTDGIAELGTLRFGERWIPPPRHPRPRSPTTASSTSTWPPPVHPGLSVWSMPRYTRCILRLLRVLRPFDGVLPYWLEMGPCTLLQKASTRLRAIPLYRLLTA